MAVLIINLSTGFWGCGVRVLGFRAWDASTGSNGSLADTSTVGGSTAYSSDTDTISIAVAGIGSPVYGTTGNDANLAGDHNHDLILGGTGNDKFFAMSGGDNIITGGTGKDQFWIATAEISDAANIITDFTSGEDVLGIAGLGIGFDDLSISQQEDNTLIAVNGSDLAILQGIGADSLVVNNFLFV